MERGGRRDASDDLLRIRLDDPDGEHNRLLMDDDGDRDMLERRPAADFGAGRRRAKADAEEDSPSPAVRRRSPAPEPRMNLEADNEPASAEDELAEEDELLDAADEPETTQEEYLAARALAERKFGFIKLVAFLVVANSGLAAVSLWEIWPNGKLWFLWPLSLSVVTIAVLYVRIYLCGGFDFRTMIENWLDSMTQAEMRRTRGPR